MQENNIIKKEQKIEKMEFSISNKAKRLVFSLIAAGILFTIIGFFTSEGNLFERFMTNFLINGFFFFAVALGALFFLALSYATESAWYVVIKKQIEAIFSYLPVGILTMLVIFIILSITKGGGIYAWMDPAQVNADELLVHKSSFLNPIFFWVRMILYMAVYYVFYRGFKRRSAQEDIEGGTVIHFKNFHKAVLFLVFFAFFSSTSAWDWIMSVDIHWWSALFGWYVFAGFWCSAMIAILILVMYLKKLGHLPKVNENHIHDIGKWIFATSFLWSYLWFAQFMLQWYANMSEEVIYHFARINHFKVLYFTMFVINFAIPMLLLMSREAKRNFTILASIGIIVFIGHWFDVYLMITPGARGWSANFSFMELGLMLLFLGSFIYIILNSVAKNPLSVKHHPFLDESIHHEF